MKGRQLALATLQLYGLEWLLYTVTGLLPGARAWEWPVVASAVMLSICAANVGVIAAWNAVEAWRLIRKIIREGARPVTIHVVRSREFYDTRPGGCLTYAPPAPRYIRDGAVTWTDGMQVVPARTPAMMSQEELEDFKDAWEKNFGSKWEY